MKTRIIIAEDHDLTRQSLVFGLRKHQNIEIIGEASNGLEAVELAKQKSPDLIIMDIGMPVLDGIEATREVKEVNPDIKVLIFTSHKERANALSAFNSGADGYCVKSIKIPELIDLVDTVMSGVLWVDPAIAKFMLEAFADRDFIAKQLADEKQSKIEKFDLTARELEILKLISDGLNNKEICEKLFLSMSTVKNHVSHIIQKLLVSDRTQAAIVAIKESLV